MYLSTSWCVWQRSIWQRDVWQHCDNKLSKYLQNIKLKFPIAIVEYALQYVQGVDFMHGFLGLSLTKLQTYLVKYKVLKHPS